MEPLKKGQPDFELRPPDAQPEANAEKKTGHRLIWGALGVVIVLGLAVVLVLPKLVSGSRDEPVAGTDESHVVESPQVAAEQLAKARSDAEQALQDFLHIRARLELANAPVWGEPEWSRALDGSARGNELFGQRQFSRAAEVLTDSKALLLLLESESGLRLENALNSGWQALQANESEVAEDFFELALSIEADNESATEGLQQAQVRPGLLVLMATGDLALSAQDLPGAQHAYRAASELDDAYEPAQTALNAVTEEITDMAFRDAMSRALSALEAEQVQTAGEALRQAASLKPGEEVVGNTQQQLAQLKQRLWLASQREKALAEQSGENWADAAAIYSKVLASEPQAGFARQGLAFTEDRQRLHAQFDHYLDDPARLYSDEPRLNAEALLDSAGTAPAAEPRLAEKISRLQGLIKDAQTPLTVILQSDGLTHVLIYHIGRLGQFTSQQLELRPGTYTIVGSRPGYRDVRQTFTLKPGSKQPRLDIRCEEPV